MRNLLFVFTFLFISLVAFAQKDAHTLLYKVSGNGLKSPSYLYGTIHMICEDDFFIMDELSIALGKVKALYLEIDITDSASIGQAMIKMVDPTMMDFYAEIDDNAKIQIEQMLLEVGLSFDMAKMFKPMMLSMLMTQSLYDCAITSYEIELAAMAKEAGISLRALETIEDQIAVFDAIPVEEQLQSLVELATDMATAREGLRDMIKFYTEMNLVGLMKAIGDDSIMEHDEVLLTKRNQNWIPIMVKQMRANPTLFAVGAAHLPGDNGVIQLLKDKGFKVEPVI
jgi:uncharacterized protein